MIQRPEKTIQHIVVRDSLARSTSAKLRERLWSKYRKPFSDIMFPITSMIDDQIHDEAYFPDDER